MRSVFTTLCPTVRKSALLAVIVATVLLMPTLASAGPVWYQLSFTGADIWTYSADSATQSRSDQDAPRRYATYNSPTGVPDGSGPRVEQATTYGVNNGVLPDGTAGFNSWMATSGFAFDQINLWGKGGTGDWNETFTSVGTACPLGIGDCGVSSWKVLASPTGWSSGIVLGGQDYSFDPGADPARAFPVWRSAGMTDMLGLANKNDPAFVFTFQVLADPALLDANGNLRVFFGGFSDNKQQTGPDNYEVSGVMLLKATAVPDAGSTLTLLGLAMIGVGALRRRLS
jgi:hypothetical protein